MCWCIMEFLLLLVLQLCLNVFGDPSCHRCRDPDIEEAKLGNVWVRLEADTPELYQLVH